MLDGCREKRNLRGELDPVARGHRKANGIGGLHDIVNQPKISKEISFTVGGDIRST